MYLLAFNIVSAVGWLVVLALTIVAIAANPATGSSHNAFDVLRYVPATHHQSWSVVAPVQSLAAFEVVHVASRLILVWAIVARFASTHASPIYTTMVLAWSLTEVPRYSYYALGLLGVHPPRWLTWLRYSAFYILYPIGAGSEALLALSTISEWRNGLYANWSLEDWLKAAMVLIWIPVSHYTKVVTTKNIDAHCPSPPLTDRPRSLHKLRRGGNFKTPLLSLQVWANPLPGVRLAAAGLLSSGNNVTTISLQDETDGVDDYEYFGPLSFGSQDQTLQIDFDTGSADIWVPVHCNSCGTLSQFQANASSTFQNMSQPFAVEYGSGSVTGTLAMDTVSVGPLKVLNQSIGAVQSVSDNFAYSPNDGLAGMAFGSIANSHKPTFFENLIPQLKAPLFSIYTTRNQTRGSETRRKPVEIAVAWVPVVSKTYWTVSMTGALVNNTPAYAGVVKAIIDTGTSFIYVPTHVMTAIFDKIPDIAPAHDYDNGFYVYPCDTPYHGIVCTRRTYAGARSARSELGTVCERYVGQRSPMQGLDFPFAILGDSFLKSYMTIFDYSNGARVGFVESINE
ncbi:aspartic peptidase domain-containing protein [Boletus edulis]|nr:aspartic peptidase domain-containing protein [Boletus edulis]